MSAQELRVMTYNLHGCIGRDRRYDPGRIVAVIREADPDILGMQEVRRNTDEELELFDLLAEEYPDRYTLFHPSLRDSRGDYGNALVSRFPIQEQRIIDLDDPEADYPKGRPEARHAILARLEHDTGPLEVLVTHLALERGLRRYQGEKLIDIVREFSAGSDDPMFFMGDFNEWRLSSAFLKELDKLFSRHIARRSFPSRFPLLSLDKIWTTPNVEPLRIWAHRSRLSRRASDHLPLWLDCRLRGR